MTPEQLVAQAMKQAKYYIDRLAAMTPEQLAEYRALQRARSNKAYSEDADLRALGAFYNAGFEFDEFDELDEDMPGAVAL